MSEVLLKTIANIKPLNQQAMLNAKEHLDKLLKPKVSLGKLEELAIQLAGIYGACPQRLGKKAIVMMAADNGVYEEGFHAYPQEITQAIMKMAKKGVIGVSVLARQAEASLVVVDIGVKGKVAGEHILHRKIKEGTENITKGAAMTRKEAIQAIEVGIEVTTSLIDQGVDVLGTGEVGICNTTTSGAVLAALSKRPVEDVVGKGSGGDEHSYHLKLESVKKALVVNNPNPQDPLDVLSKVGGLDIAGLVGCYLAAAYAKKPIVIDGFIAGVAALLAFKLNPLVKEYLIPSHLSEEKGAGIVLEYLGLEPMLLLKMWLGEGTGAALSFYLIDAACRIMDEMGTFAELAD